jgi:hypothetical protein
MQHEPAIPDAVLSATLADGSTVAAVVGDETPIVRDLSASTVDDFRDVWKTRRDTDFPSLAEIGRISGETERTWVARVTDLLAFVDEHRAAGLRGFAFIAAKVSVLYSPARDTAFVVDLANHPVQSDDLASRAFSNPIFALAWVAFLAFVLRQFWWIRNAALVWWVYGRDAYRHGMRVLPGTPIRFSNGQLAPDGPDLATGFAFFMLVVLGLSLLLIFGLRTFERFRSRQSAA